MSDDRKKPPWPWIAVLVGLPVLYVASFGPACWLTARPLLSEVRTPHPAMSAYIPIGYIGNHAPLAVRTVVFKYAWLCVARDEYILLKDFDGSQYLPPRK
jgi:hypothetical protein